MQATDYVRCDSFPCQGLNHNHYLVPSIDLNPDGIAVVMISEAAPENASDYYYAGGDALFERTTLLAFQDAGAPVTSFADILDLGVYLTTAVKCGKIGYGIKAGPIKECSFLLERELSLFPNAQAYMLMGDVAIKALNYIALRQGEPKVIPPGSTYKIRGGEFHFRHIRAFPSYLQAGPSFGIEKSKRRMIAEDIAAALALVKDRP
jgi:uracil-DNA glycosylase